MSPRGIAAMLVVPLLLAGCGGSEPPKSVPKGEPCKSQGTVGAKPAPSIRAAVAPYQDPGQRFHLQERLKGTATVRLEGTGPDVKPETVTLVHTHEGWAVTTVADC
jgi:hypothetical protein